MKTVSVRLNEEEEKAFSAYATIMGMPLSTLFKKLMEERLEDEFDLKIAEDFLDRDAKGDVTTRPIDALFQELDL
ncbi:type II toxin-antitoxin system RelB family antitoxin [Aedoeadaptatus coli]|uniref:type II toxin-antitoxin system RelB family antitoxin n=1 Tax=Aedoeadaptatus coli TaxID=2058292 RepID=UPI000D54B547|nr:DUF6290 family protein [Peptoniphilus coli]